MRPATRAGRGGRLLEGVGIDSVGMTGWVQRVDRLRLKSQLSFCRYPWGRWPPFIEKEKNELIRGFLVHTTRTEHAEDLLPRDETMETPGTHTPTVAPPARSADSKRIKIDGDDGSAIATENSMVWCPERMENELIQCLR
jgi:hypothetical protein